MKEYLEGRIDESLQKAQERHIIDCDNGILITPEGWSIHKNDQVLTTIKGSYEWKRERVQLIQKPEQKKRWVVGDDLVKWLEGKRILDDHVLDYLLVHQGLIPNDWKKKQVFFSTIYRGRVNTRFLRCLCHRGWRWDWDAYCLNAGWGRDDYVASEV